MKEGILLIVMFFIKGVLVLAQTPKADYVFTNIQIVDVVNNTVQPHQTLTVRDGKIVEIAKRSTGEGERIIDGKGAYVMATLADAHVHFPATEAEMERVLKLNLINGITKIRSMRGDWKHAKWREQFNAAQSSYPKLYLSPPVIHHSYDLTDEQIDSYVESAKAYQMDHIKILSIKNTSMFQKFCEKSKEYGIPIGGHFPVLAEGVLEDKLLFDSDYAYIEHLGGLIGERQQYNARVKYLVDKQIYSCPTLLWYTVAYGQYNIDEMLNQRGMEYIDTAVKEQWVTNAKAYRTKLGEAAFQAEVSKYALEMEERFKAVKELNEAGAPLLLSPDSSSAFLVPGFGVLEEMKLYQKAGLSNWAILKAATTNFAALYKENYGSIEVGKDADFMLLIENPLENLSALQNIEGVFYNQLYLNREQLNDIAQSIEVAQ
ncbi:amidohydrolase family protein [Flavobacterium sp. JP2137]|uniref:amidohydrolase family protein n=1 Tax=Flavobacterium sp. JP2137 TaxID=3414510 RepID=UPI003D2FE436